MITEIIFIILTFLITGYGIYRFGREEELGQQIEVQNNVINNDFNNDNEPLNDSINNEIINDNIINNINNGNTNNNINFFKNQVMQIIVTKEENNMIDWGDLEETAKVILKFLIPNVKRMVKNPSEEIKKILKEERSKRGEEVVKKWIDKNKGEEDVKKWIDINSGFFMKTKFAEISTLIYNSKENTYMFKNIDTDKKEKKHLLKGAEIIGFLNKIKKEEETGKKLLNGNRYDKKDLNSSNIPINNENIININNDFEEQVNEQIETNKKNINWKNLPGAAQEIYNCLDKDAKLELGALEKIEDILKEKKSIGEKEAAMKLLNRHKENINIKTLATFVSSDENIYQNTSEEIIYILLNEPNRQLSDGENIQLQAIQMELLGKIAEERQKKLEEEKLREEEEKKKEEEKFLEEKKKREEIDSKAKEAQKKIVKEPDQNNPDATTICFRYPDGTTTKNRRFLKSNKIQDLYVYVTSLGNEIYSEEEHNGFSLYQPFPPKKYEHMGNTLEEEKLCPNAVIQIRED